VAGSDQPFRVLLIRPPYTRLRGIGQAPYFPLGIGSMAAVLNAIPGVEARVYYAEHPGAGEKPLVIDKKSVFSTRAQAQATYIKALETNDHPAWIEAERVLRDYQPHLVGLSVLTPETASALRLTRLSKSILPETPIIWGGVHPSFEIHATVLLPGVDYVIAGEGEQTLMETVSALRGNSDPSAVPGVFSNHSPPGDTCARTLIERLDDLPPPDRDAVFFPERFTPAAMGSLMHSRGCPWRCGFCSSRRFWNERVRFRSAEAVIDEILKINRDFGIRIFTFWDDSFTIDRRLTEELCETILRSPVKIAWRTATRLDLLDDTLLKLMRKAGCFQVELGIETGSPRMSELIRKDIDLDTAPAIIDKANRHGIACGVFLMAGFPDETRDDLMQTLDFIKRIKPAEIVLNIFDPMPGSEQYERAIELGLLPDPIDFTRFPLWPDAHFMAHVSASEFNQIIDEISKYVFLYNSGRTALMRRARPEILQLMRTDRKVLVQKAFRVFGRLLRRSHL
jgi:anaerobic magnesium-protoporphyrin IX monomethyl ester cyclase